MSYNRTRTNSDLTVPATYTHYGYQQNGTQMVLGTKVTPNFERTLDVMHDVVTPNFRKLREQGNIIVNPASRIVEKVVHPTSFYEARWVGTGNPGSNPVRVSGQGGSFLEFALTSSPPALQSAYFDVSDLVAEAKMKAIANIDKTPYNFMEDVMELKETSRYILDRYRSVYKIVDKARKKFRRLHPEDAYLEYRFAIQPLIKSCTDLYMSSFVNNKSKRRFMRATGKAEKVVVVNEPLVLAGGLSYAHDDRMAVVARAGMYYTDRSPNNTWRDTYGVRNKDLPVGLWNVVPLSFMVDRIVDISSFVKGVTNFLDPSLQILQGWYKVDVRREESLSVYAHSVPLWVIDVYSSRLITSSQWYRYPWQPTFSDTIPRFTPKKLVADLTSIADLGALIKARMTK